MPILPKVLDALMMCSFRRMDMKVSLKTVIETLIHIYKSADVTSCSLTSEIDTYVYTEETEHFSLGTKNVQ